MTAPVLAVRWHAARDVRLDEIVRTPPDRGFVEIAVAYCGVCGSDLHEIADGPHAIPVDAPHQLSGMSAPITLGHEFSGTVSAVGADVTHVRVGDAVVIEPNYRCGRCDQCRMGRYHTCASFGFVGLMGNGGLAEHATVPGYMVHRLPSGFDLASAAVLEPAAVALHAVRRSSFAPGGTAAVVGLGPVGLLVGQLLRIKGASRILGIDPEPSRREAALTTGFDQVADPTTIEPGQATGEDAVDVSFEVVGRQSAVDLAISLARVGGEIILLGLAPRISLAAFDFVNSEKTLKASVGYNNCHAELIDLVESGTLDLRPLITRIVPLRHASETLTRMASGGNTGIKTLVDCRA